MSTTTTKIPKLYKLTRDSHGGIGAIATSPISLGTIILTEPPLVLLPSTDHEPTIQSIITSQIGPTGTPSRNKFNALHDAYADPPHKKTALGIIRSNGYPAAGGIVPTGGLGKEEAVGGIFPMYARFNSSCSSPNVTHRYDPDCNLLSVFAARDIGRGEELLTCYVDPTVESKERRAYLLERFKFECMCEACHGDNVYEHDQKRKQLTSLDNDIYSHIRGGQYPLALNAVESRLELLRDEKLDSPQMLLRTYNDGYQCCDHSGDLVKALGYLRNVCDMQRLCDGSKSRLEESARDLKFLEDRVK